MASLNPFESLRKYLIFRHKRDQDRRYREAAEARKLELENEASELVLIEKRAKIAKQLGATKEDLQTLCCQALGTRHNKTSDVVIVPALPAPAQRLLTEGAGEAQGLPSQTPPQPETPAPNPTGEIGKPGNSPSDAFS